MSETIKIPKKLIEVVLPLDDINAACAYEKMPGIGPHPRGIHLWWARRPLAAARAVIFAQMVNDPGYQQGGGFKFGVNKKQASMEREKLFDIMRDFVKWENTNNNEVLARAQDAINMSWREICDLNKDHPQAAELFDPENLPALHDPFAGGGAIPLEAQRLGLESYASQKTWNPVRPVFLINDEVMINKAMALTNLIKAKDSLQNQERTDLNRLSSALNGKNLSCWCLSGAIPMKEKQCNRIVLATE